MFAKQSLPRHDEARAYAKRICGFADSDVIGTSDEFIDDGKTGYVSVLFRGRSWQDNSVTETSMGVWFETRADGSRYLYGEW